MQQPAAPGEALPPDGESLADFPDENRAPHAPAHGPLARLAYALGGAGLLAATATDAIAVAGRHTGLHLLGSIELVQSAVVLLATSGMLIATLVGGHASVHIVTERLSRPAAARLARIAAFASGLTFLALAAGSIWLAYDLWNGFEQTELLHIPLRWLRTLWIVFALVIAGCFFRAALAPSSAGVRA